MRNEKGLQFNGCESYTVGVEWELQLLDEATLDLTPGIEALLEAFESNPYVKPELIQSCVELNTRVSRSGAEIASHLSELIADVSRVCKAHGIVLAGAGTHPFCQRLALITELPRFQRSAAEHGYIAQTQLAFATHVHVGVGSGDEAIRTMRYLTSALPLLIALSANSPFWRGHSTGYACYRRRLLAASRSYGIPPTFDTWQDFSLFYAMASRAGSFHSIKDIHWDIRPHPDFGTLEVRVMDAQSDVSGVAFLASLVRVLVAWIGKSDKTEIESVIPGSLSPWIDRENHYRASHWGMHADLIADESGETRPLLSYVYDLAGAISSVADEIGEVNVASELAALSADDCGYRLQQNVYTEREQIYAVAEFLRDCMAPPDYRSASRGSRVVHSLH